jgi:hypothetical protein
MMRLWHAGRLPRVDRAEHKAELEVSWSDRIA